MFHLPIISCTKLAFSFLCWDYFIKLPFKSQRCGFTLNIFIWINNIRGNFRYGYQILYQHYPRTSSQHRYRYTPAIQNKTSGHVHRNSPMLGCFSRRQIRASLSSFWWSEERKSRDMSNHRAATCLCIVNWSTHWVQQRPRLKRTLWWYSEGLNHEATWHHIRTNLEKLMQ